MTESDRQAAAIRRASAAYEEARRLYAAVCDAADGDALTFERSPGDDRTVAVLDVLAPGRWLWRFYAAGWLLVGAFGAGMAVATLVWVVTS